MPDINQKTILLVEDEPIIAMVHKRILISNGYQVMIARTGEQAIEMADQNNHINLILMDINLGAGIDGTDAAKIILDRHDIPLVFLSSHTEKEVVEKTEDITSYGYIVKDSGETVLLASMKMAFKLFDAKVKEKEKENALKESESRYYSLFDNISSGVAIYTAVNNGEDFIFKDFNKAGEKIDGECKEDVLGQSVLKIRPAIKDFGLFDVFKRVWESGRPEYFPLKVYKDHRLNKYYDNYVYKLPSGEIVAVYNDHTDVKRIEESLSENETLFSGLFLNHSAVKFIINPVNGAIVDANLAAEKFYGWSREQLKNMYITQINTLSKEEVKEAMQKALSFKENFFRFKHRKANGSISDVEVFSSTINIKGEPLLHTIVHDVTRGVQAEEAMKSNTDYFNILLDTIPVGIFYKDTDGRYTGLNLAFANILNKPKHEIIGKSVFDIATPKMAKIYHEKDNELLQKQGIQVYESSIINDNNETKDVIFHKASLIDTDKKIIGLVGVVFDITEQKRIKNELYQSEERFRLLSTDLPSFVCEYLPDSTLLFVNQKYCEYFGYTPEELNGQKFMNFIPEDERNDLYNSYMALTPEEPVLMFTHKVIKNNEVRWHEWSDRAIFDNNRKIVKFIGVGNDITDRINTESQIIQLLKEKELLLKEVHHRIKNNMNTINCLLMLQASDQTDQKIKNVLSDSANRVQRMMILYDKLYQYETYNEMSLKLFLPFLVKEIVESSDYNKKIKTIIHIDDVILKSKFLLPVGIIINELITNSIKYAFANIDNPEIGLQVHYLNQVVKMTYHDNGKGLPEDFHHETSKGFGMQLINMLVKQIKGTLSVSSNHRMQITIEFRNPS
ncbi:MAG TPA: PAS domain S-box protein [Candidatus Cloacimonadota bacterium]|mgnify:CR=1 FL=1|nr:PAS domain S-box protein [Candidatus Cloacimonadota bacterium]